MRHCAKHSEETTQLVSQRQLERRGSEALKRGRPVRRWCSSFAIFRKKAQATSGSPLTCQLPKLREKWVAVSSFLVDVWAVLWCFSRGAVVSDVAGSFHIVVFRLFALAHWTVRVKYGVSMS